MAATGKKMLERNIIGLVITFVTASAVSGWDTSDPTAKPMSRKQSAPARAIGIAAQAVVDMEMPNAIAPKATSTPTCRSASIMDAATRDIRNSDSGIGVSF